MSVINLHSIFCHLARDEHFLSTVIETNSMESEKKKNKNKGFNMMENIGAEYAPLAPFETQAYAFLPAKFKAFLTPDYARLGIRNMMEKDLNMINISFLNSLNILLRPELYKATNQDVQIKNLALLEEFICHKIHRNCQIDKVKNTRKIQTINKELIKDLTEAKITHNLISYIVNIFEINLLIFDLDKMETSLYWASGHKYPYLNLFKNIYCMSFVQRNFEPIMPINTTVTAEQQRKIYLHILTNHTEIICNQEIKLTHCSLIYLNSWTIDPESYSKIIENFFEKPKKTYLCYLNELASLK